MLHYFNELFGGYPGQMLHYFHAVMRSGSVCLYDAAACTLHDCFILKKEDAVRFVVIIERVMGVPAV